jgi:heat shock protein HtpX
LSTVWIAIGGMLGQQSLVVFTAIALVMNFVAYFWSDKIVLRMQHAREVDERQAPRLHTMVAELAARAGIPKPRIYIVPEAQPNAFATGRNPEHAAVAVTEGIMDILNQRELRGVLAHELAHIKNRDILIATVAAAIATAVTYIANIVQWGAIFGGAHGDDDEGQSPLAALALAIVAPLAATLIQLAISRSREYEADRTGAQISGDPAALANALEKLHFGAQRIAALPVPATASLFIVNPFSGQGGITSWFSTHPPMEERIRRLMLLERTGAAAA